MDVGSDVREELVPLGAINASEAFSLAPREPLTPAEFVGLGVPADSQHVFRWPAPEHDALRAKIA
jgi:hypothetical protein